MTTCVPTLTRLNRSMMSLLCIRMQPQETKPPTDPGLLVPWIASSLSASTSAAAPIGFLGESEGMIQFGLPRLISAGGDQAGRRFLLAIRVEPNHCLSTRPTPTEY